VTAINQIIEKPTKNALRSSRYNASSGRAAVTVLQNAPVRVEPKKKKASSVKSVGHLGFWKFAEGMVQGYLSDVESPVSIGFSHRDLCLVVESFYDAARELFFGAKIIEDEVAVAA
jgi:hypothetical protein